MLKLALFAALANLALSALAQNVQLPPENTSPPPVKEWVAAIDPAKVPQAPLQPDISQPRQCEKAKAFCHWACDNCIREQTDFTKCPKGQWAITFDDGPTEFTPPLLDFLAKEKIKATFFVLGSKVRDHAPFLQRAFQDGHEIASHSWSHSALTSLTNEQIIAEMKWTEIAIQQTIGVRPKYMRPPYGDIDDRVRALMVLMGYKVVIWNKDTFDWRLRENKITPAEVDGNFTQWINEAATAQTGSILLEHDHAEPSVNAAIRNLPRLAKAYKLVPLSACIGDTSVYQGVSNLAPSSSGLPTVAAPASMVAAPGASNLPSAPIVAMSIPLSLPAGAANPTAGPSAPQVPVKSSASKRMASFGAVSFLLASLMLL
ncbi:uncharacterized protein VTP21DRAFT_3476 [Calcarisporiella thermophila]|uniref:uncharacterized protein n=1 Tax=Calcarisporiella thermophila TaxID=911321 RepID=UPI0037420C9E